MVGLTMGSPLFSGLAYGAASLLHAKASQECLECYHKSRVEVRVTCSSLTARPSVARPGNKVFTGNLGGLESSKGYVS